MPSSKTAIFLGLDETLVLTSAPEPLRKLKKWPLVYASFAQTQLPPETMKFTADVKVTGASDGNRTQHPSYSWSCLSL
jgi:hypothetical protein